MWQHARAATPHIRKMPQRPLVYSTVVAAVLFCLTSQVRGNRAAASTCATGEDADSDRVNVSFNLENRRTSPFPSDVFTADDPTQLTGRRLALRLQDCDVRPNDCEDLAVINTLDGFSGSPRVSIPFTDMVDLATVNSNSVFLLRLSDAMSGENSDSVGVERVGGNHWTWDTPACTLHFQADGLLDQHARYAVVVTSGVRDEGGRPVQAPGFERFRRKLNTTSEHFGAYRRVLLDALTTAEQAGISDVVALSVFTTRSITSALERIREDLRSHAPAPADFTLPDATRLAFPASDIGSIVIKRHINTSTENPFSDQTFSRSVIQALLQIVPGAVAYITLGKYLSPDYRDASRTLPAGGTRIWQPNRQAMTEIYFILFVPSGEKPAGGWPVVIYGAGSSGTLLEATNFASINAAHGFATISINNIGIGFGPLTTMTITEISGGSVSFEWKGRSVDENGDGVIEGGEGRNAIHAEIIGARDSNLQVVADLMQLVRVIEAGMDWDGDGAPDLDASRVAYEGHSYGAGVGLMLVGVEQAVTTAAFLSVPGADLWRSAGLAVGSRNGIGALLASRNPSLLTSPGIDCLDRLPLSPASPCTEGLAVPPTTPPLLWNEDMPALDAPPLLLTVVGAPAIQEWFDNRNWVRQSGASVPYAQYIRRRPLPGRQPTPVIVAVAKGDQTIPNPSAWESVRAGELEDRVTFFRNDLAFAQDSRMPKNPHRFSWFLDLQAPGSPPLRVQVGRWAQTQAALFFASLGAVTIDPDGPGLLFETPIQGSLPEGLHYIR